MKYFFLSLICALVGVQMCQAFCSSTTPVAMSGFNENSFVKQWYVVGSSIAGLPTGATCLRYTIKNFDAASKTFNFDYLLAIKTQGYNTTTSTTGTWVESEIGSGNVDESIEAIGAVPKNWKVLATDYISYAVIYDCRTGSSIDFVTYYLLSTNPVGHKPARAAAGANLPPYMIVLDNYCPII